MSQEWPQHSQGEGKGTSFSLAFGLNVTSMALLMLENGESEPVPADGALPSRRVDCEINVILMRQI